MYQFLFGLRTVDVEHVMCHLGHRGVGLVDGVRDRVAEEPRDELVDAVVQRRRKQQALATIRRRGQDPRDAGQKTEIGHVIRLVDHGDLDRVEADQTLLHQVLGRPGQATTMSTPDLSAAT